MAVLHSFTVVYVAEQAGLGLTWSESLRQIFSHQGPYDYVIHVVIPLVVRLYMEIIHKL